MASGMVNPRPIAPKPAAPKTSYTTPAVIAKPVVKSSGGYSGIPTTAAANKPVTGGKSSNQATIDSMNKQLLSDQKLLNDLLNQYVSGNTGGGGGGGGGRVLSFSQVINQMQMLLKINQLQPQILVINILRED